MPWSGGQFELAASNYHEASCVEIKKMIMKQSWDRHIEEQWYERVEDRAREVLTITEDLPDRWQLLPQQIAQLLSEVTPAPPEAFIVDALATSIGLLIGAWRKYVERFARTFAPDELLAISKARPKLDDFLTAISWPASQLQVHPSLALSDLRERLCRGEGGKAEEYQQRFGVSIRQPQFTCFMTVQDIEGSAFTLGDTLPVFGSFVVGRQRKHNGEPEPVSFVEHPAGNRLVVAGKNQAAYCSREQLFVSMLTPTYVYVKNMSEVISVKIQGSANESVSSEPAEVRSELMPNVSQTSILAFGEARIMRVPFSILLPAKALRFSNR